VVVDGTVDGDLLVTGGEIIVNGAVHGSLLAAARTVTINGQVAGALYTGGTELILGREAVIEHNLFFGGFSLTSEPGSLVKRDLAVGAYQALLNGEIQRNLRAGVGALELNGIVAGDVYAEVGEPGVNPQANTWRYFAGQDMPAAVDPGLRIGSDAQIGGKLNYVSNVEQSSGIAAQPKGGVAYGAPAAGTTLSYTPPTAQETALQWLWLRLRHLLTLFVLGALALWLIPKVFQRVADCVWAEPLPATLWGFVVTIIGYIAAVVALVVLVLLTVGLYRITLGGLAGAAFWSGATVLGTLFTLFTLLVVYGSKLVVVYPIGRWILARLQGRQPEQPAMLYQLWPLFVGVFLYVLVAGVPYLGPVVGLIVTLIGVGAMWLSLRERGNKAVAPKLVLSPT
jgi:hypothetical protein